MERGEPVACPRGSQNVSEARVRVRLDCVSRRARTHPGGRSILKESGNEA